jgi:hypothetical protein
MANTEIAIGLELNYLTIVSEDTTKKYRVKHWLCECVCGNFRSFSETELLVYGKKSCGCATTSHDLTNQKFGKLTAIKKSKLKSAKCIKWQCECNCGNIVYVRSSHLISGAIQSCGCINRNDLTDMQFGKLKVIKLQNYKLNNTLVWQCKCACGEIQDFRANALSFGTTHQCTKCSKALAMSFRQIKNLEPLSDRAKQQKYFYFKKFDTFLKVGIGNKRRVNDKISKELLYIMSGTFYDTLHFEYTIKTKFFKYRKEPEINNFGGRTECFYLENKEEISSYIESNYLKYNLIKVTINL